MAAYSSAQQEALKEFKQDIGHLNALSNSKSAKADYDSRCSR